MSPVGDEDIQFELGVPVPSEWTISCPWCGGPVDVQMRENDAGNFEGAMDDCPGNAFAECPVSDCGCHIEIATMIVAPLRALPPLRTKTKKAADPGGEPGSAADPESG